MKNLQTKKSKKLEMLIYMYKIKQLNNMVLPDCVYNDDKKLIWIMVIPEKAWYSYHVQLYVPV